MLGGRFNGRRFLLKVIIMKREIITGTLQGNERGYAFLLPDDKTKSDYFIPHGDLRGAMHGDKVICETTNGSGERTTARVLKIVQRGISEIVGTYFSCKSGGFVRPDDNKYFVDVFIPFGKGLRAKVGDKVVCKILSYPKRKSPEGIVSKILGRQFDKKTELKSILYNYKLPQSFSMSVVEQAENLPREIGKEELNKRADYRKLLTMTIDGEDSRDFDDAVSIEKTKDGNYVLGVHIADVSHYVKQGDDIDDEAFERGTSVYFPEKVIPMLPERLSNDLCSLIEGADRLTLSCVMTVNGLGKVIDRKITPSVIRSTKRLTYGEVQKVIDGEKSTITKTSKIFKSLVVMKELAEILIAKRDENGSIDLDVKESQIIVEKSGEISVTPAPKDMAHRIIEEFMILANCTVAEYFYYLDVPFIYRVHDKPETDRLEIFYSFLSSLGINPKRKKDEIFPKDFQTILKNAENSAVYPLINRVMLRSMQKAVYSPMPKGHFGLGEKYYCHFTSPIRRYPDLAIHRIIKDVLQNGIENIENKYSDFVEEASVQSSLKERNAMDAERAVDTYYKMLYIENYVGEVFDGFVSGVINSGLFVELENGVEGFVKAESLGGRRYVYDSKNYSLSNGRKTFRLGQKVKIKVFGVNIIERKAEFLLIKDDKDKEKD